MPKGTVADNSQTIQKTCLFYENMKKLGNIFLILGYTYKSNTKTGGRVRGASRAGISYNASIYIQKYGICFLGFPQFLYMFFFYLYVVLRFDGLYVVGFCLLTAAPDMQTLPFNMAVPWASLFFCSNWWRCRFPPLCTSLSSSSRRGPRRLYESNWQNSCIERKRAERRRQR